MEPEFEVEITLKTNNFDRLEEVLEQIEDLCRDNRIDYDEGMIYEN